LPRIVGQTKPGSRVTIEIWRKGKAKNIAIVVGEITDEATTIRAAPDQPAQTRNTIAKLGLTVSSLSADQRRELDIKGGVIVEQVDGPAARAGIRRGDIVLALNNHDVKSIDQLKQLMAEYSKARSVALLVRRGQGAIYVPIRLDGN
jgi:serine protease Do